MSMTKPSAARRLDTVDYVLGVVRSTLHELEDPDSWVNRWKGNMPPAVFHQEFKILSLTLPRSMGTTTAAIKMYEEHKPSTLLVPSLAEKQDIYFRFREHKRSAFDKIYAIPPPNDSMSWSLLGERNRGLRYKLCIIDGARRVSEEARDRIMATYDRNTTLFVLLG